MKPLRDRNREKGFALVMVLWVLSILSIIALELSHAARIELKLASNLKEETQSYYLARAGIERGIAQILIQSAEESNPEIWDFGGEVKTLSFGGGAVEVRVMDESGKINLNSTDETRLARLLHQALGFMGVDAPSQDIVIDSILDWRDPDNLHRTNGAEDDHYRSLGYEAKDGPLDSVDELLMIKGVSKEIFFGQSGPQASPNSQPAVGLKDLVTVDPKLGRSQKLQINRAPYQVLVALGATEDEAKSVIEYRRGTRIEGPDELKAALGTGVLPAWETYFTYSQQRGERVFTVSATGSIPGSPLKRSVRATISVKGDNLPVYRIVRWADRPRNELWIG